MRRRPVRIVSGVTQGGWTDQWEIICPACGDDINLDYVTTSPFLQRIRGPYASEPEGLAALRQHRGETATVAEAATSDPEKTVPNRILPTPDEQPASVGAPGGPGAPGAPGGPGGPGGPGTDESATAQSGTGQRF